MNESGSAAASQRMPGHLIRRLHQRSTRVFQQHVRAAGYDLTPVQFAALDALRFNAGIDQAGLAKAIAKDRATTGAVVDRLEQKGLLSRLVSRQDRRARELTLTERGEAVMAALLPIVDQLQRDILPGLDDREVVQFIRLALKATRTAASEEDV